MRLEKQASQIPYLVTLNILYSSYVIISGSYQSSCREKKKESHSEPRSKRPFKLGTHVAMGTSRQRFRRTLLTARNTIQRQQTSRLSVLPRKLGVLKIRHPPSVRATVNLSSKPQPPLPATSLLPETKMKTDRLWLASERQWRWARARTLAKEPAGPWRNPLASPATSGRLLAFERTGQWEKTFKLRGYF